MTIPTAAGRLHATIGGTGPSVLLVPGWPQTAHAWRLVAPGLAARRTVVVADPRGVGGSDKPQDGYDTGTLAADLVDLMTALGHERFAVAGHDVGMWIGYALAADHPERVTRLAVAEAVLPGVTPSPPLLSPRAVNDRLWHFGFNRLDGVNEALVRGREAVFFGGQFAAKAARPLDPAAIAVYLEALRAPDALRASFGPYRALEATMAQNERRAARGPLRIPVLAIGGARSTGAGVADTMRRVAADVRELVIDDCGHYPAEEAPDAVTAALDAFLPAV